MKGVLLMAYGSPATMDGVEAYYTHIRGGRKPSAEQLEDLVLRYRAIGGPSPLLRITNDQARTLQAELQQAGSSTRVYAGMKHSEPFIAEMVARAKSDGVGQLLCIVLAPHYSSISTGGYMRAVEAANSAGPGLQVTFVKSWHDNPLLVKMWAAKVMAAGVDAGEGAEVVFSAHSLPERIISEGDPYRDQLLATSSMVAMSANREKWSFAFQSASKTGEPWLGPDIVSHLQQRSESGARAFILAPLGFVSDHLEILYDLDVEAKAWADRAGVAMRRCPSPNASPEFIGCLRSIVEAQGFV